MARHDGWIGGNLWDRRHPGEEVIGMHLRDSWGLGGGLQRTAFQKKKKGPSCQGKEDTASGAEIWGRGTRPRQKAPVRCREEEEACLLQGWCNAMSRVKALQKSVEQWDVYQVSQKALPFFGYVASPSGFGDIAPVWGPLCGSSQSTPRAQPVWEARVSPSTRGSPS